MLVLHGLLDFAWLLLASPSVADHDGWESASAPHAVGVDVFIDLWCSRECG